MQNFQIGLLFILFVVVACHVSKPDPVVNPGYGKMVNIYIPTCLQNGEDSKIICHLYSDKNASMVSVLQNKFVLNWGFLSKEVFKTGKCHFDFGACRFNFKDHLRPGWKCIGAIICPGLSNPIVSFK